MSDTLLSLIPRGKDNGSWSTTIEPGASVTIPKGYHDGTGTVTSNKGSIKYLKLGPYNTGVSTSRTTVNLSSYLNSSIYTKLTADSVVIEPANWTISWGGHSKPGYKNMPISKSYTPSTGVLSFTAGGYTNDGLDITWGGTYIYVYVFYIE